MIKIRNMFRTFEYWKFGFVSNFGFSASDFYDNWRYTAFIKRPLKWVIN